MKSNDQDQPSDLRKAKRQGPSPQRTLIDRLPPHALEAEMGVIACILIAPDSSMPVCLEKFSGNGETFYDLRNRKLFNLLTEMYDSRAPIDLLTLRQFAQDRHQLEEIGGTSYISSLPDTVPSAANISYYADILHEKYVLRRMIQTCSAAVARVYEDESAPEEMLEEVERQILEINTAHATEAVVPMLELVRRAIDTLEKYQQNQGVLTGIATGFTDLDKMTNGLHPAEIFVIAGRPSMGKAQPLDAKVLTPSGFVQMRDIAVGMEVIGSAGVPVRVLGVYAQGERPVSRVILSDGSETRCCDEHLWFTQTRNERRRGWRGSIKTTAQIRQTIRREDGANRNHALPLVAPIQFLERDPLPLHPWLLGALIGDGKLNDGSVTFHKPEHDVIDRVSKLLPIGDTAVPIAGGVRIKRLVRANAPAETRRIIDSLGLRLYSEKKFIPEIYLYSSVNARWLLLRGLLDTDGSVTTNNGCEYCTSSPRLARDFVMLARSLGVGVHVAERQTFFTHKGQRKPGLPSWRIHLTPRCGSEPLVSSEKHQAKLKQLSQGFHRSIMEIKQAGIEPCQCIRVDAADGIYLTDDFIPTHNSSVALNIAEHVAVNLGLPVGLFSLEMSSDSLMLRLLCGRARVSMNSMRDGFMAERDFPRLTHAAGKLSTAPLFIDDTSGLSILQLRARARRMAQQYGIKLFVVDFLQLLHSTRRKSDNREQEIADISRGVKHLAKELGVPIIELSQLNREVERNGGKPKLSNLRESGSIEQDADIVGLLYTPKEDDEQEDYGREAVPVNLLVAKNRSGPTGEVPLTFLRNYTRFETASCLSRDGDASAQRQFPDP